MNLEKTIKAKTERVSNTKNELLKLEKCTKVRKTFLAWKYAMKIELISNQEDKCFLQKAQSSFFSGTPKSEADLFYSSPEKEAQAEKLTDNFHSTKKFILLKQRFSKIRLHWM